MSNLKLVVSNKSFPQEPPPLPQPLSKVGFTVAVHSRGTYLYEMILQDPSHKLECNLTLEVEAHNVVEPETVICHFPRICDEDLQELIEEDETLFRTILIQFQMKTLKEILLFCTRHGASKLIIYTDDDQAEELNMFYNSPVYQAQTVAPQEERTEVVIASTPETFAAWLGFMAETTFKFSQELWRKQHSNPIIRQYLISRS